MEKMKPNELASLGAATPINILLADDDEDDRHFFKRILGEMDINTRLTTVVDGEKLLHYLVENSSNLPDIIFMDFNMPRKNGLLCLSEMSVNDKLRHLPVIIYSTSLQVNNADLLYDLGAYYYVRKTGLEKLKKYVHHILTMVMENKLVKPAREGFIVNLVD
jgi:CheY-like chemotaxis protein